MHLRLFFWTAHRIRDFKYLFCNQNKNPFFSKQCINDINKTLLHKMHNIGASSPPKPFASFQWWGLFLPILLRARAGECTAPSEYTLPWAAGGGRAIYPDYTSNTEPTGNISRNSYQLFLHVLPLSFFSVYWNFMYSTQYRTWTNQNDPL